MLMRKERGESPMVKRSAVLPQRLEAHTFLKPERGPIVSRSRVETFFPLHWHDFYELELVTCGRGTHVINGLTHPLGRGVAYLLTPADFHEMLAEPGEPLSIVNIKFSESLLPESLRSALFLRQSLRMALFSDAEAAAIERECERLRDETEQPQPLGALVIRGTFERLLVELYRRLPQEPAPAAPAPGERVGPPQAAASRSETIQQALRFIQQHYRRPLSLEETAAAVHLSPGYFSECFHHETGISFVHYVQQLRLQFAASLLGGSQLPVTEICYAAGFHSLSHFIRTFKSRFQLSPSAYRQERSR